MTDSPRTTLAARPHRPDESMSLLVDIAAQALDPGYAAAAARDGEPAAGARSRRSFLLLAAGVLAATLLVVVAGVQAHRRAPAATRTHDALLVQVSRRQAAVTSLQSRLDRLRARTTSLRDLALTSSAAGSRLARRLSAEELAAGTVAVTGAGLQVVLDDAPTSGDRAGNPVVDRDVQAVVNALWAAGAEAVSVNDQRVTAQTAVREAGGAILVNFQPLTPPYVVAAVGDPVAMETRFGAGPVAARMRDYAQLYGLRFHYDRATDLTLPPAPGLSLRYATVAPTGAAR